jgi:hypothetical protein
LWLIVQTTPHRFPKSADLQKNRSPLLERGVLLTPTRTGASSSIYPAGCK